MWLAWRGTELLQIHIFATIMRVLVSILNWRIQKIADKFVRKDSFCGLAVINNS